MKAHFDRHRPDQLRLLQTDGGPDEFLGRNYETDEDLEAAVNVALVLGRPLLVSGAPGCGKTQLGYAIARNLGIERVYFFPVKSTSEARDLFYSYDAIGRFQAVQIAAAERQLSDAVDWTVLNVGDYIEYRALGAAILDAHEEQSVSHLLAGRYQHSGQPQRSVVVVDEIDKASRDFPNDLLDEIDRMKFRVPELLHAARVDGPRWPDSSNRFGGPEGARASCPRRLPQAASSQRHLRPRSRLVCGSRSSRPSWSRDISPNASPSPPNCDLHNPSVSVCLTSAAARLLRRHLCHHHPRHFRIKPANAVSPNNKIRRVENMPFYKIQLTCH
jgi:hypothetical protein